MKFAKWAAVLVVILLFVFMASAAMAVNVTNRSAEMDDFSACDRAGTIEYRFTQADWNILAAHLATNDFARIRVALNGLSLPPSPRLPLLCKDITGSIDGAALGAQGGNLPYNNLVALQTVGVEVSGIGGDIDGMDLRAYVHGLSGRQYFEIFITEIDKVTPFDFDIDPPWIKVGLYNELIDAGDDEHTAICASVLDFSGVSTLTISNEALPNTLTFTGDNEIGHFLTLKASIRDCGKPDHIYVPDSDHPIPLCPIVGSEQSLGACNLHLKCFVIEGDIPIDGDFEVVLRTNGAVNGSREQKGVYFLDIDGLPMEEFDLPALVFNGAGELVLPKAGWEHLKADGVTPADPSCSFMELGGFVSNIWEEEHVRGVFRAEDFAGGKIHFVLFYTVNPEEAIPDTHVRFWVDISRMPCGTVAKGVVTAALLVKCNQSLTYEIYFPYLVTQYAPWQTGIALTHLGASQWETVSAIENLGVASSKLVNGHGVDVPIDEMRAKLILTDSTGEKFTYEKKDFSQVVWAVMIDGILSEFSGTPAPGPAWLKVEANFPVDGYHFMTDGNFGAGTLARLMRNPR